MGSGPLFCGKGMVNSQSGSCGLVMIVESHKAKESMWGGGGDG